MGKIAEHFNKLLSQLRERTGLKKLLLNANGQCHFLYRNLFEVSMTAPPRGEFLYFRAPLLSLAHEAPSGLFQRLLASHFRGEGTHGAVWAIDSRAHELVLWQGLPLANLEYTEFEARFSAFLLEATRWHDILQRSPEEQSLAPPSLPQTSPSPSKLTPPHSILRI